MPHLIRLAHYFGGIGGSAVSPYSLTSPTSSLNLTNLTGAATDYVQILDYYPASAELDTLSIPRGPLGMGADVPLVGTKNAVDSMQILIVASTEANLRDRIRDILSYQRRAHDWSRYPGGSSESGPVYLEMSIKNTGLLVRSRIRAMRVDLDKGAIDFAQWGTRKVKATLYIERDPFWETPAITALTLFAGAASGTTVTVINNPATTGQQIFWVDPTYSFAGDIPSPANLRLEYIGDSVAGDAGDTIARVWVGAQLGLVPGTNNVLQAEDYDTTASSGVTLTTGNALLSGSSGAVCAGATGRIAFVVPIKWTETMRGWNRLLVRMSANPSNTAGFRMRAKWSVLGLSDIWVGPWLTFENVGGEISGQIVDMGAVPMPPDPRLPLQGDFTYLMIEWAGSPASFTMDYLVAISMRSFANFRYIGFGLGYASLLQHYDEQTYDISPGPAAHSRPSGSVYSKVIRVVGGPLYVLPGTISRQFVVVAENDAGAALLTRQMNVSMSYRPRYLVVPEA